jgi:hypothetical protein
MESGIGLGVLFGGMCDSWVSGLAELEASMGWRPGQAYSQRERILAAIDGGMSVREAARLFRVSISYIYKALIRRRLTGEAAARSPSTVTSARTRPPIATCESRPVPSSGSSVTAYRFTFLARRLSGAPSVPEAGPPDPDRRVWRR